MTRRDPKQSFSGAKRDQKKGQRFTPDDIVRAVTAVEERGYRSAVWRSPPQA
jgi:hypothetical protein